MSQLTEHANDLYAAFPAALSRILLGHRTDAKATILFTIGEKLSALAGALCFALMAGQLARSFEQTSGYTTVIIIAAAFTAQDTAVALIKRSRKELKKLKPDDENN